MYRLVDTSTNGTCVNGVRLPKGGEGAPLAEGDRIRLAAQTTDPTKLVECAPCCCQPGSMPCCLHVHQEPMMME